MHTKIEIRLKQTKIIKDKAGAEEPKNGLCKTTVGRVIFNSILPEGMPFYNYTLDLKGISKIIQDCYKLLGRGKTIILLDDIKETGFKACTKAGLSFAITDIKMPAKKPEIIDKTQEEIERIQKLYRKGIITEGERYNQIIDMWTYAGERVAEEMLSELKNDVRDGKPYLNPVYLMSASGAQEVVHNS